MEDFSAQERQTLDFAAQTTKTVRTVCSDAPDWIAEVSIRKGVWKAKIAAPDDKPVVLTIDCRRLLRLKVSYECTTSPRHSYMLVEKSAFILLPAEGSEPLVRLEYLRRPHIASALRRLSSPQRPGAGAGCLRSCCTTIRSGRLACLRTNSGPAGM